MQVKIRKTFLLRVLKQYKPSLIHRFVENINSVTTFLVGTPNLDRILKSHQNKGFEIWNNSYKIPSQRGNEP